MIKKFSWALALFLAAQGASAALIQADVRSEGDLPHQGNTSPKVFEQLNASLSAPVVLDDATVTSNTSGWGGAQTSVSYNASTNVLTITNLDAWDFSTFNVALGNIAFDQAGEYITGLSLLSNGLVDLAVTPTLSFGVNSIGINYNAYDAGFGNEAFNFIKDGTATFQIATSIAPVNAVPEPGTLALMGLGLVGLAISRQRR